MDLPFYPKGCYLASYGNSSLQKVWLNNAVGAENVFSRLLCARVKPCGAGTYKLSSAQTGCNDCEIGTYQALSGQSSCNPCPNGHYGVRARAISETDGCRLCPAGTYKDDRTPGGTCSICAPGTFSNASGMDHCDACSKGTTVCPGGAVLPYTDAQWAVAQRLLPESPKPVIDKQCQTNAPQFFRKDGTAVADDAGTPSGPSSPVRLSLTAVCVLAAAFALALHPFIPESLWSRFDLTALYHLVPQGGSSIKRNTPLGCAFSVALSFCAAAVAAGLYDANVVLESSALVLLKRAARTTLRVSLNLPLGDQLGDSTPYCAGIAYVQKSLQGMSCNNEIRNSSLGKFCDVVLANCTFTSPSARLTFDVPWHERYVEWTVYVDSTFEAMEHSLSGNTTSGSPSYLIPPEQEVVVAMLAQHALLNDTTNAKLTKDGFLLKDLPCVPPKPVPAEGWNLAFPQGVITPAWKLTIELRASQNLYETVRSRKQDPLTLTMGILAAVTSLIGISKPVFTWVEGPISNFRKFCARAYHRRKQRRYSEQELQTVAHGTLLAEPGAKSAEAATKDDVAATVKAERTKWLQAINDVDKTLQQHEQTILQREQTSQQLHQQHEQAIQKLRQQHERDISELHQTIKQLQDALHAAVASFRGTQGRLEIS